MVPGQPRGFHRVMGGINGGLLGREQRFQLVAEAGHTAFGIGEVAVRGGIQHHEEAAQRVAGRGDDGAFMATIQLQRQGGGKETQTFLEARLQGAARASGNGVGLQAVQSSKGARPGAASFTPSGSTAYSPVKQA